MPQGRSPGRIHSLHRNRLRTRVAAISVLITLCLPIPASALNPDRTLDQYSHTAWRRKDGAPSQVDAFAQTPDRVLWIGCAEGLYRFDGVEFERITSLAGTQLPPGPIHALVVDDQGRLLIGHSRGDGISVYDGRQLRRIVPAQKLNLISAIFTRADDRLLVVADDRLWELQGTKLHRFGAEEGLPPGAIGGIYMDKAGNLNVTVYESDHVFRLQPGQNTFRKGPATSGGTLTAGPDGTLWASHQAGVLAVSDPFGEREKIHHVISTPTGKILFDRDGGQWLHTPSGIHHLGDPKRLLATTTDAKPLLLDVMGEKDGLSANGILRLFEDRDGAIWVGTMRGIDRFVEQRFAPVRTSIYKQTLSMVALDNGDVLLAPWAGPAMILQQDGHEHPVPSLPNGILAMTRARDGTVLAAGKRLWRSTKDAGFSEFTPAPERGGYITMLAADSSGDPWIFRHPDRSLHRLRGGQWEKVAAPSTVGTEPLTALYIDEQDGVWRAFDSWLVRSSTATPEAVTQQTRISTIGRIRVISRQGQQVWLGGDEGLALLNGSRLLTLTDPLGAPVRQVIELLRLSNGDLWVHQQEGAVRISAQSIAHAIATGSTAVDLERFGADKGLPGTRWTSSSAMAQDTNGRLWISTDEVVAWTDPYEDESRSSVARPYIRRAAVDGGNPQAPTGVMTIAPGMRQLQIDYGSISPSTPQGAEFRYRLEGYEDGWQFAGARRLALYTNLPPGDYKFVLSAAMDGHWAEPVSMAISVLPAWHQTAWFRALCIAAFAIAVVIAYRLRIRQVTSRVRELLAAKQAERDRIGQELHDSLLQAVYATILRVDLLARKLPADDPVRSGMKAEAAQLESVAKETRRRVAGAHAPPLPGDTLLEELERYGRPLLDAQGIHFEASAAGAPPALSPRVHDEVRAIAKEALMNASRHSMAQKVSLSLSSTDNHLLLEVEDNGVGMDESTRSQGVAGHWGLPGIHERARRLGGQAEIDSKPGDGTRIKLRVPLPATT